jgi:hypothetical protein
MSLTKQQLMRMPETSALIKEFVTLFVTDKPIDSDLKKFSSRILGVEKIEPGAFRIVKFRSKAYHSVFAEVIGNSALYCFPGLKDEHPSYKGMGVSLEELSNRTYIWEVYEVERTSDSAHFKIGDTIIYPGNLVPTELRSFTWNKDFLEINTDNGPYPLASIKNIS